MVFSSLYFLCVFLPIFLLSFYLFRKDLRKWVIVIFSGLFYAWGAPTFILFLLGSSVIDFFLSKYLGSEKKYRKQLLWSSLTLNIGLLVYFKYANFFVDAFSNVSTIFGFGNFEISQVLLPIGISFFTFQKISYTLDVYSDRNKPLTSFLDYLLYIMMFPQLIAGPIVRFQDVSDQIKNYASNKLNDKLYGLFRFIVGLSKKVLIANTFAEVVTQINSYGIDNLSMAEAWLGILAYTFQIYFDFSGYSDMAIGLGLMIGFKFPENFNFPYLSKSITEFWQRWHITLGTWMRDYLYIPLGGNRVSNFRVYFNLMFVFFISGFWHGANWNFIIWGLFHGLFLMLERAGLLTFIKKLPGFLQVLYTFFIVIVGWVFFSMPFDSALSYLIKMFSFSGFELYEPIRLKTGIIMGLGLFFAFMAINRKINNFLNGITELIAKNKLLTLIFYPVFIMLFLLSFFTLMTGEFNPFIYYRF
tara:strand:- start:910 stop:2325 length:1416 start_codon:yes stop_codon:yes gene_type:complete